jgi:hypothetical protein
LKKRQKYTLFECGPLGGETVHISPSEWAFCNLKAVPKRKMKFVLLSDIPGAVRYLLPCDFGNRCWKSEEKNHVMNIGAKTLVPWKCFKHLMDTWHGHRAMAIWNLSFVYTSEGCCWPDLLIILKIPCNELVIIIVSIEIIILIILLIVISIAISNYWLMLMDISGNIFLRCWYSPRDISAPKENILGYIPKNRGQ